uniref:Major facilitator superfamily (MFS) profile domain-containing protein n=1 Tax=Prorocentrum micans TaxID=2945 RepID=A0A7S2TFC7_PROMC
MIGPKSLLWVNLLSFVGLGAGMGIIDGATPSLLAEVASDRFGGSGKIFVLSNVAVQLGFAVGPVLGNAIVGHYGFGVCSAVTGAALLACVPLVRGRRASSA